MQQLARDVSPTPFVSDELLARYDVPTPRYTSYPTVPHWTGAVGSERHAAALTAMAAHPEAPLSMYVHLPFCAHRCTFCGCNVVVTRAREVLDRYLDDVLRELQLVADHLGARRQLAQVHLGGGTPTMFDEAQLERLWTGISRHFQVVPDAEVAIEIDPRATAVSQLRLLRQLGFNRLSFGVQDLDADVQAAIGRFQTEEQTRGMLEASRAAGFPVVSWDLVYGLPRQSAASWQTTLSKMVALAPDRVALYSYAHVPELRPQQRRLKLVSAPVAREKLDLLLLATEEMVGAGYRRIGMDHFARPGDELARGLASGHLHRNFQGYTVRRADDVVALGVTGISDAGGVYAQNTRDLERYHAALDEGRLPTERGYALDEDDRRRRALITDLMCRFEADLSALPPGDLPDLTRLEADGLIVRDGQRLTVTELGRLFVRAIARAFDSHASRAAATHSRGV
jgi:oxygen-independent coproporphyrinogen-3 oxidase